MEALNTFSTALKAKNNNDADNKGENNLLNQYWTPNKSDVQLSTRRFIRFRRNKYYTQVTMSHDDDILIKKLHSMIKEELATTFNTTINKKYRRDSATCRK